MEFCCDKTLVCKRLDFFKNYSLLCGGALKLQQQPKAKAPANNWLRLSQE